MQRTVKGPWFFHKPKWTTNQSVQIHHKEVEMHIHTHSLAVFCKYLCTHTFIRLHVTSFAVMSLLKGVWSLEMWKWLFYKALLQMTLHTILFHVLCQLTGSRYFSIFNWVTILPRFITDSKISVKIATALHTLLGHVWVHTWNSTQSRCSVCM